jgi:hypothetical protein
MAGVLGVSPSHKSPPKIGGFRGLKDNISAISKGKAGILACHSSRGAPFLKMRGIQHWFSRGVIRPTLFVNYASFFNPEQIYKQASTIKANMNMP